MSVPDALRDYCAIRVRSDSKIRSATKQKFHFLKRAAGEGEIIHIWVVVFTHIWVVIMTLLQYDVSEPLQRGMRTVH
jgi:hypothetical protein